MDVVDLEKNVFRLSRGGALTARNNLLTIIRTSDVFRINQLNSILDLFKSLNYCPIICNGKNVAKSVQNVENAHLRILVQSSEVKLKLRRQCLFEISFETYGLSFGKKVAKCGKNGKKYFQMLRWIILMKNRSSHMLYLTITISTNRKCLKLRHYYVMMTSSLRNDVISNMRRRKRGLNRIELEIFWIPQSTLIQRLTNTISWLRSCLRGSNRKLSFSTNQILRIILMVSSGNSLSLTHIGKH